MCIRDRSATEPLRIAGLKGPTTMGLVNLLSMEQAGTAAMDYDLQLYGAAEDVYKRQQGAPMAAATAASWSVSPTITQAAGSMPVRRR